MPELFSICRRKEVGLLMIASFLASALLLFPPKNVHAECPCREDVLKLQDKYRQARIIFSGKIIAIVEENQEFNVTFEIKDVYKGNLANTVKVNTITPEAVAANCSDRLLSGDNYLVYAYGSGKKADDYYYTEGCPLVKRLNQAKDDLKFLAQYRQPRRQQLDRTETVQKQSESN